MRFNELLCEISKLEWDIITINETWREEACEYFRVSEGHIFAGAGGELKKGGVALLVHRRWSNFCTNFSPVNNRLAFLDIKSRNFSGRVVSAYFPHSGYSDQHVQSMYTIISQVKLEATSKKVNFILGADCNAEVGSRDDGDDASVIGPHGLGVGNSQGEWLKSWASSENLIITNTFYSKRPEYRWTFRGPNGRSRQIDFIFVDKDFGKYLQDASSTSSLDLGSDHRAVRVVSVLPGQPRLGTRERKTKSCSRWSAVMPQMYLQKLEDQLRDVTNSSGLETFCRDIEEALKEAAGQSRTENQRISVTVSQQAAYLDELIAKRRATEDRNARKLLSHEISRQVRKVRREAQTAKIRRIMTEFKGFKQIAEIKGGGRRHGIAEMRDKDGHLQSNRQDIADIFAEFYGELYATKQNTQNENDPASHPLGPSVPAFSRQEIIEGIRSLKAGKAPDPAGICAEMLQAPNDTLITLLLQLYNCLLAAEAPTPEAWKTTIVTVVHKSGDRKLPQNYRPISMIPMLYKLFAKLLSRRLTPILERSQPHEQAGFQKGYSTVDQIFALAQHKRSARSGSKTYGLLRSTSKRRSTLSNTLAFGQHSGTKMYHPTTYPCSRDYTTLKSARYGRTY